MKFALQFIIFIICSVPLSGQKISKANAGQKEIIFENIDVAHAKKIMAASNNFVLLDVRTPEEIANGKIDNAIEMDIKAPDFKEKLATLDKEKQYIVYCHAGGRSATAMQMMKDMGFKQVYNLISGYRAWPKNK